jgi:hypothetical protein
VFPFIDGLSLCALDAPKSALGVIVGNVGLWKQVPAERASKNKRLADRVRAVTAKTIWKF